MGLDGLHSLFRPYSLSRPFIVWAWCSTIVVPHSAHTTSSEYLFCSFILVGRHLFCRTHWTLSQPSCVTGAGWGSSNTKHSSLGCPAMRAPPYNACQYNPECVPQHIRRFSRGGFYTVNYRKHLDKMRPHKAVAKKLRLRFFHRQTVMRRLKKGTGD